MATIPQDLGREVLFLLPEEITASDDYQVRAWSSDDEDENELRRIEELAATLERDGQLDAAIAIKGRDGKPILLAGHRRRKAVALVNDRRSASGRPLMKLRVEIDPGAGDSFRKAVVSNLHRKDFSPMDLALLIRKIRAQHQWEKFAGAKKVAEYLGVNVATVTQHEKFLLAPKEIQEMLHSGKITAQAAYDLLAVPPEQRQSVVEKAREIQESEAIDEAIEAVESGKLTNEEAAANLKPKEKLERRAVVAAIRETPTVAEQAPIARTRKEIIEKFMEYDSPTYGHIDGAVRVWADYFVNKWAMGKGTDKTLDRYFDAMVEKASKGTRPPKESETWPGPKTSRQPKLSKSAKPAKKLPRKDKGESRKSKDAATAAISNPKPKKG